MATIGGSCAARLLFVLAAAGLNGCALITAPKFDEVMTQPTPVLDHVPFFPQERYQCGPAALATVLTAGGEAATPEQLVAEVYLPGRRGSLQPELVSAVRRRGRVPYVSESDVGTLDDMLAAGVPPLVLLNLSSRFFPIWHYAVVIGTDPERHRVVLRSGTDPDRRMSWWRFERAWFLSDYWALAVLPDEHIPDFVDPIAYIRAVAPWERTDAVRARTAYAAATTRWPDLAAPWVALGNVDAAAGRPAQALAAYAEALSREPDQWVALNNAADQLGAVGCPALGVSLIDAALAQSASARWQEALRATRSELQARPAAGADGCPDWQQRFDRSQIHSAESRS